MLEKTPKYVLNRQIVQHRWANKNIRHAQPLPRACRSPCKARFQHIICIQFEIDIWDNAMFFLAALAVASAILGTASASPLTESGGVAAFGPVDTTTTSSLPFAADDDDDDGGGDDDDCGDGDGDGDGDDDRRASRTRDDGGGDDDGDGNCFSLTRKYCDATTSVCYAQVRKNRVIFRVAIPDVSAAPFDIIYQVVAPISTGWAGISWGGEMADSPLTLAWANGQSTISSSRWAR